MRLEGVVIESREIIENRHACARETYVSRLFLFGAIRASSINNASPGDYDARVHHVN